MTSLQVRLCDKMWNFVPSVTTGRLFFFYSLLFRGLILARKRQPQAPPRGFERWQPKTKNKSVAEWNGDKDRHLEAEAQNGRTRELRKRDNATDTEWVVLWERCLFYKPFPTTSSHTLDLSRPRIRN